MKFKCFCATNCYFFPSQKKTKQYCIILVKPFDTCELPRRLDATYKRVGSELIRWKRTDGHICYRNYITLLPFAFFPLFLHWNVNPSICFLAFRWNMWSSATCRPCRECCIDTCRLKECCSLMALRKTRRWEKTWFPSRICEDVQCVCFWMPLISTFMFVTG